MFFYKFRIIFNIFITCCVKVLYDKNSTFISLNYFNTFLVIANFFSEIQFSIKLMYKIIFKEI